MYAKKGELVARRKRGCLGEVFFFLEMPKSPRDHHHFGIFLLFLLACGDWRWRRRKKRVRFGITSKSSW